MPRLIKKRTHKESRDENIHNIVEHVKETAAARQKQLMIGGIAILLVIVVVVVTMYTKADKARKLADLEYRGYKEFNGLLVATPQPSSIRAELALSYFQQASQISPTPFNQYYIGLSQYEMGQYETAAETFQKFVDTYPTEVSFMPPALYKLGMSHLKAGKSEQALTIFARFRQVGIKSFGDLAILESARILESLGRMDESYTMYETLIFEFPQSMFASEARDKTEKIEPTKAGPYDRPLVLRPADDAEGAFGDNTLKVR
jgi:TolA-binding protein